MSWRHLALAGTFLYGALCSPGNYLERTVDLCKESRTIKEIISEYPYSLEQEVENKLELVDSINKFLDQHEYYKDKKSFCTFFPGGKDERWNLYVVKKGSQDLELSTIGDDKQALEDIKATYDEKTYDISLFKIYSPGAPLTPNFLQKDNETIARFIIHERFHEINDPYQQSPIIMEESMAEMLEHAVAREFFNSEYGKPWNKSAKEVEDHLEKRLKTAENYIRAYEDLEPIINNLNYSVELKDEMAQPIFARLKEEEGLKNINWSNFASDFKYLRHLPLFNTMHLVLGNDSSNTIREFMKIEEKHQDSDNNVDAKEALAEISSIYSGLINTPKAISIDKVATFYIPRIPAIPFVHPLF